MRKIFLITIAILCSISMADAQDKFLSGQYLQNLPAFNPALTGANDFLDLRMGYTSQWMRSEGAPSTFYLSGYGSINPAKKESISRYSASANGPGGYIPMGSGFLLRAKQGVGGNLYRNEQGPYSQVGFNMNYALHIPIREETFVSLGLSPGIYHAKVDFSRVGVKDTTTDHSYLNTLKNGEFSTFFRMGGGLALYSNRYYAAYSMMRLTHVHISGNESLNNNDAEVKYQVLGGYRFSLNQDFELIPNAFVRVEKSMPILWDAGARVQYKGQFWLGTSYRNDNSLIGMLGLLYNDMIRIGYSFEFKADTSDTFNSGSHEIVVGLQLFNHSARTSMW